MNKLLLSFAILTLSITAQDASVTQDLRTEVDLTKSVGALDEIQVIYHTEDNNVVDISTKRASDILGRMMTEIGGRSSLTHYVLNKIEGVENGQLIEKWRIANDLMGKRIYEVIIQTTNINDLENPVHQQVVKYQCIHYEYAERTLCIHDGCSLDPFVPNPTPGVICAKNYRYSQELIAVVYESTHNSENTNLGEGVYDITLECMKNKIETMPIKGEEVCYYEGFKPLNITPISEIREKLEGEGWTELKDGTFERKSTIETKTADVKVDENNMAIESNN